MKTHAEWPARRFDQMNRDAIDTRPAESVSACSGNCAQGDYCDCAPKPAEACTELGANQPRRARLGPIGPMHRLVLARRPSYTWAVMLMAIAAAAVKVLL
jgi:hypothetical protein